MSKKNKSNGHLYDDQNLEVVTEKKQRQQN